MFEDQIAEAIIEKNETKKRDEDLETTEEEKEVGRVTKGLSAILVVLLFITLALGLIALGLYFLSTIAGLIAAFFGYIGATGYGGLIRQ